MARITVSVKVLGRGRIRNVRLPERARVIDLLKMLDLNPEVVLVRCKGRFVIERERLSSGDFVEVLPVVTGG